MISINQVLDGVARYLDSEILSKYPSGGWQKVVAGSFVGLALRGYADKIADNTLLKGVGIIDDEGNVDIDLLANEVMRHVPASGMKIEIPMLGEAVFRADDISDLVETIKGRSI